MNARPERWLLPDGINEILPEQAARLEALRRRLLDMYRGWGYELVMPPFIEYLESLLTGTGHDLDLQTFKLTDQLTGRLMGVRADMTPQVARIDAHSLRRPGPTRLCYIGTVLQTRPDGFAGSRSPLQVGAELYGHAGIESDVEVLSLMLDTLEEAGIGNLYLDLGHVGIYRAVAGAAGLGEDEEARVFDLLQRKALPELEGFVVDAKLPAAAARMLRDLARLNGGRDTLAEAGDRLGPAGEPVREAIGYLDELAGRIERRYPAATVHFDLAELRGYHYHTGVVFAAYVPGRGQEIARGGRYDDVGGVFGRARAATGFTTDLKTLVALGHPPGEARPRRAILAPADEDARLLARVRSLRAAGEVVIQALPGAQATAAELGCDRQLRRKGDEWELSEA